MGSWDFYEKCNKCNKPLVNAKNLKKLRLLIIGSTASMGIFGVALLPLLGFTAGGSVAASWQSSIGAVAAGSLFAILQSLGATGLGTLVFGGIGSALGLLASVAQRLGWCICDDNDNDNDNDMHSHQSLTKSETNWILPD